MSYLNPDLANGVHVSLSEFVENQCVLSTTMLCIGHLGKIIVFTMANPEELVWSQGERRKRKRRLRTILQPPSLIGHLKPSVVCNVFSLEIV